jgi:DNA-binding NarL/FixJ family response regulator
LIGNTERNEYFAVVITDRGMPHVDGRKAGSAIKNDWPSIRISIK